MCKPNKMGWAPARTAKELFKLRNMQEEIDAATSPKADEDAAAG